MIGHHPGIGGHDSGISSNSLEFLTILPVSLRPFNSHGTQRAGQQDSNEKTDRNTPP